MDEKRCPKCGSVMVAGCVCDSAVGFWSETRQPALGPQDERKGSPMYAIVTYRCSVCGFLEWYADAYRRATKTLV